MKHPFWEIDTTSHSKEKCTVWIAILIFLSSLFTSMTFKALFFNIFYEQCKGGIIPESLDIILSKHTQCSSYLNMDVVRFPETASCCYCDGFPCGCCSTYQWPWLQDQIHCSGQTQTVLEAVVDHHWLRCTLITTKISKCEGSKEVYKISSPVLSCSKW